MAVPYLSERENKQLHSTTQTSGSSVYIWLSFAHGNEGDSFGLDYLDVALRRYTQATLFFVSWEDRMLDLPVVQFRWVYNRKRGLLYPQAKYENSKWPRSRFNVICNVTDEIIHRTARGKTNTLYDVTGYGAKRACRRAPLDETKSTSQPKTPESSAIETVPINGYTDSYTGRLDTRKRTIEIYAGDIANTGNIVTYCQGIAAQAFQQYPTCKFCKISWDVVAFNETTSGIFVFRRTAAGTKRID